MKKETKDFQYNNYGYSAVAFASKKIVNGEIIGFEVYKRDSEDSRELIFKRPFYFGLVKDTYKKGRNIALRMHSSENINGDGSSSLIPSWYDEKYVTDPIYISAAITEILTRFGSDYFLIN